MKKLLILLLLLPFWTSARTFYLAEGDSLPSDKIDALEARCQLKSVRPGVQTAWSLIWPGSAATLFFDYRGDECAVEVECAEQRARLTKIDAQQPISLAIEWHGDKAVLLAGNDELQPLLELGALPRPSAGLVRLNALTDRLEGEIMVQTDPHDISRLQTDYPLENPDVWEYLDMETDKRTERGGAYSLAMVPTEGGYDLIYLGGAKVNGSAWRPGMLKATLRTRGFQGHYELTWYDPMGRQIPGENYARLDSDSGLLTLTFPALRATLRLAQKK